jgi:hypothetical protein
MCFWASEGGHGRRHRIRIRACRRGRDPTWHDGEVVGDEPSVVLDFAGMESYVKG